MEPPARTKAFGSGAYRDHAHRFTCPHGEYAGIGMSGILVFEVQHNHNNVECICGVVRHMGATPKVRGIYFLSEDMRLTRGG